MANQDPDENRSQDQEQDSQQGGGGKRSKSLLDYSLSPMKDAVAFSIQYQHPAVVSFLNSIGGTYLCSNGIRITLGEVFGPEWKESLNTIRLDGTNGRALNRPDITRFAPVREDLPFSNNIMRNKIAEFNAAMAEFIDTVNILRSPGGTSSSSTSNKAEVYKISLP